MSDQSTPDTEATSDPISDSDASVVRSPERRSIEGELINDHVETSVVGATPEPDNAPTAGQQDDPAEPVEVAKEGADAQPAPSTQAVLALGGSAGGIEITGLHENQVSVLQEQHAKGLIEVQRKASELKVDIQALDQTLESLTSQARSANDAGVNITATHTQNTTLGQTEIIVGNTQRAAAGKVAPLWAGLESSQMRTGLMVGAAVLAGVLLSALFG